MVPVTSSVLLLKLDKLGSCSAAVMVADGCAASQLAATLLELRTSTRRRGAAADVNTVKY